MRIGEFQKRATLCRCANLRIHSEKGGSRGRAGLAGVGRSGWSCVTKRKAERRAMYGPYSPHQHLEVFQIRGGLLKQLRSLEVAEAGAARVLAVERDDPVVV